MRDKQNTSLLTSRLKNTVTAKSDSPSIDTSSLRPSKDSADRIPQYGSKPSRHKRRIRKKLKSQTKTIAPSPAPDTLESASDYDASLEQEFLHTAEKRKHSAVFKGKLILMMQVALIALCVYVAFLIYGVTVTRYTYDEQGQVVPQILSVSDLKTLDQYEILSAYYLRARILYEKSLALDYRLSEEPDNAMVIAMEYTALLDDVAKLSVDISAEKYDTGYSSIYSQLLTWVKTDIAVYLQNIAAAITNNDSDKANNALVSREVMYSDFSKLTGNIVALAKSTKGAASLDLYDWSPEQYSEKLAGGD